MEVRPVDATPIDATPTPSQEAAAAAPAHDAATPVDPAAPPPGEAAATATEGGATPSGDAPRKKRRRRRRKKKPAGAAPVLGPDGNPLPVAEGATDGDADGEGDDEDDAEEGVAADADAAGESPGESAAGGAPGEGAAANKASKKKKDTPRPKGPARVKPPFAVGEEVMGTITKVMDEALMIDVAGKALGIFDRKEAPESEVFTDGERFIGKVANDGARGGLVLLTRDLNRWQLARTEVEEAFKNKTPVLGLLTGVIKGGVEVDVKGLRGFAPASHVDLRLGADLHHLIGQRMPFDVVQFAKRGREFVLSRKSMLEEDSKKTRAEALEKLEIGAIVKGIVRSVTQFGAFVDVGGVDGLVHVSEASHTGQRLSEIFKVKEEIEVKILRVDEKGKVWLSRRAVEKDPFEHVPEKYAKGTAHKGKVVRLQPFGAFIELEPGLDGLMHVSDIPSPDKRFMHPNEVLKVGQEMDVVVSNHDVVNKKIALVPPRPEGEAAAPREGNRPDRPAPAPRLSAHQAVKVVVEAQELTGLVVRIVGQTGRNAKGYITAMATGTPKGTDLRKKFPVGMELEAKITEAGPRGVKLSISALAQDQERQSFRAYQTQVKQAAKFGTFGDLLLKKGITK
ncbi:MAG: hypothetical protein NVS3B10_12390 [Polyangiales bacterium]